MPNMTFDTGSAVRIVIDRCHGELKVIGGDRTQVEVFGDRDPSRRISQAEGQLAIEGYNGDLKLKVGSEATIICRRISGDVEISNVAAVEFESVGGDLSVAGTRSLQVDAVGGDLHAELRGGEARI